MMEIQETWDWDIRQVQDEDGYWLPSRQRLVTAHARCGAHPGNGLLFTNWADLLPWESAQRWADKHNEKYHPRQIAKRRRREQILEQITPMFKELGKPASPPPRPYVRKPGEGFEDSDQI